MSEPKKPFDPEAYIRGLPATLLGRQPRLDIQSLEAGFASAQEAKEDRLAQKIAAALQPKAPGEPPVQQQRRGPKKRHSEQALFECLGKVFQETKDRDLNNREKQPAIRDRVLTRYCEVTGIQEAHSHYGRWIDAFLRGYLSDD